MTETNDSQESQNPQWFRVEIESFKINPLKILLGIAMMIILIISAFFGFSRFITAPETSIVNEVDKFRNHQDFTVNFSLVDASNFEKLSDVKFRYQESNEIAEISYDPKTGHFKGTISGNKANREIKIIAVSNIHTADTIRFQLDSEEGTAEADIHELSRTHTEFTDTTAHMK